MNKKILIIGGALMCGVVAVLFTTGSFGELSSAILRMPRPRVIAPQGDAAYVSCKKYENIQSGSSKLYLVSSKKTYATVNGETIDVSTDINRLYFEKQKIALGQPDPKKIIATIDYSSGDTFVMQSNFYMNGSPISCPSIVIGKMGGEGTLPLPECQKWIQTLQEPGITATCLGKQKLSLQVSDINLLSSLGEILHIIPKTYAYTLSPSTTDMHYTYGASETTHPPYTTSYTTETPSTSETPYTTEPYTTEPPTTYGSGKKTKVEWRCTNGQDYATATPKPCGCKNGWNGARTTTDFEEGEGEGEYIKTQTVSCPEDKLKPKWKIISGMDESDIDEIKDRTKRGEKTEDVLREITSRIGIGVRF